MEFLKPSALAFEKSGNKIESGEFVPFPCVPQRVKFVRLLVASVVGLCFFRLLRFPFDSECAPSFSARVVVVASSSSLLL